MGVTYTRKQIRDRVISMTRDSGNSRWTIAEKNRVIADIHREFVERTRCNRNVLIFSLANGSSNGVIEYDRDSTLRDSPTVTRIDVEGQNHYKISNCSRLISLSRWIGSASDDDGYFKELVPLTQSMIDSGNLLGYTVQYPVGYQQLLEADTFRLLPVLNADAYTIKLEARYFESIVDLISDDRSASDATVIQTTGSGLSDFTAGTSNASVPAKYRITIATAATPDTVNIHKDVYDGLGWVLVSSGTALTGTAQTIADKVTFTAAATTGHTAGNVFTFYVDDHLKTSIPTDYVSYMIYGVLARLWDINDDARANKYDNLYRDGIEWVRRQVNKINADRVSTLRQSYIGGGA